MALSPGRPQKLRRHSSKRFVPTAELRNFKQG